MKLDFHEPSHSYFIDCRPVPSVTQVIKSVLPQWPASPWHLDRGVQCHKATELYDLGTLDESTVDEHVAPRLEAWKKFRMQFPGKLNAIELMLGDPDHMFAGKLDRVFLADDYWVICDQKNGITPHVFIQLGGYSLLWRKKQDPIRKTKAVAVELCSNGTYLCQFMTTHELRRAEQQFLACLTIHNFMKDNGLKPQGGHDVGTYPQAHGENYHPRG